MLVPKLNIAPGWSINSTIQSQLAEIRKVIGMDNFCQYSTNPRLGIYIIDLLPAQILSIHPNDLEYDFMATMTYLDQRVIFRTDADSFDSDHVLKAPKPLLSLANVTFSDTEGTDLTAEFFDDLGEVSSFQIPASVPLEVVNGQFVRIEEVPGYCPVALLSSTSEVFPTLPESLGFTVESSVSCNDIDDYLDLCRDFDDPPS